MKKPDSSRPGRNGNMLACGEYFDLSHPKLFEFVTCERWDDGSDRKPGSITVFLDTGSLKACLADRDSGLVAFVTSKTFTGLLDVLEEGLVEGALDWRKSNGTRRK